MLRILLFAMFHVHCLVSNVIEKSGDSCVDGRWPRLRRTRLAKYERACVTLCFDSWIEACNPGWPSFDFISGPFRTEMMKVYFLIFRYSFYFLQCKYYYGMLWINRICTCFSEVSYDVSRRGERLQYRN